MKIIFSLLFAFCLNDSPCINPTVDPDEPPREVVITQTSPSLGSGDRSASQYCRAFYYCEESALEVFCNGTGSATVNLYDDSDALVDSASIVSNGRTSVWLSVPSAPGVYRLTITSANYCGEGYVWVF